MIWTLTKSGSAALVSSSAELSMLALLHALGLPLVFAYAAVQVVGMTITFTLNKLWVFDAAESGRTSTEGARSLPVFAGAFLLNTAFPSLGSYLLHLPTFAAYLISQAVVYGAWSFPMNRWFVFPEQRSLGVGDEPLEAQLELARDEIDQAA